MALLPTNLLHYVRYRLGLDAAWTTTTPDERDVLQRLAPARKVIVELGAYEGYGSLAFREAMDEDAELFCVEPFPRGRLPIQVQESIWRREIARSSNGKVIHLRCLSSEAARNWSQPVDLVFLDAAQTYEGVAQDFADWTPFIKRGGLIVIHAREICYEHQTRRNGPWRFTDEVVANNPNYRIQSIGDGVRVGLAVVEKL